MARFAWILVLAAGACTSPLPTPTVNDPASVVEIVADELWAYLLERDVYLRLAEGLPIEALPQLSPSQAGADASFAAELLARLDVVDLSALAHEDFLTARVIRRDLEFLVAFEHSYWNELSLSPYISLYTWRQVGTVLGSHALTTAEDVARFRSLLGDYVRLLEQHRTKAVGQAERGIRLPRAAIPGTIAMLEGFRDQFADQRPLDPTRVTELGPQLLAELEAEVDRRTDEVIAGYDALIELLSGDYAEVAPEAVGAYQFDGGKAHYRRMARYYTTVDLEPEAIHQLGLERVAEISEAMSAIRDEVGFTGSREAFHDTLRSNPRFVASDPQEVEDLYRAHIAGMEERIGGTARSTVRRAAADTRRGGQLDLRLLPAAGLDGAHRLLQLQRVQAQRALPGHGAVAHLPRAAARPSPPGRAPAREQDPPSLPPERVLRGLYRRVGRVRRESG